MKKSIISLIIVCCLVFAFGVISTQADTYTGSSGDNVTYTLDTETGVLTITGTGDMRNYNAPWLNYKDFVKTVVIEDGVTSIGGGAFSSCSSLTEITIPEGVTCIGDYAFSQCSGLTEITIPEGVTSIGDYSFYYCSSLTEITIPEGVTSIGKYSFYYCDNLTEITIPEGVTSIGDSAFQGCSSLTEITIPEGVTSIGGSVFQGCSDLTEITIPEGVTSIGNYAFSFCGGLTEITIPESVTSIGDNAFYCCSRLTEITIPEGVTSIGDYAFSSCSSLTEITIPESVTSIGNSAFSYCWGLTDVYYNGTEEEWNAISIGTENTYLTTATIHYKMPNITFDDVVVETDGSIVLGTDNGDGTYSLPENVVGYYIDDKFVDAGVYDVTGGEVITTVDFNVTMVNGAQVRYGGGLDENGKVTSGNGLRFPGNGRQKQL